MVAAKRERDEEGIRFEGVGFQYPGTGKWALRKLDLFIPKGQSLALVGHNGAGKTTLISLLLRFINPESGRILIDGQDIHSVRLSTLRRQIGVVTQETILFSGSIADNIRYGCPEATDAEVEAAARVANAWDFISELPEGLQTDVGERGQRLSGGQLQRLALARAVLGNPPILVLDEATSAVDAQSEALIQQALARVMEGRTTFVIAHRISTVRRADRIVVVDEGRIVEQGNHRELLARKGSYDRLFAEQLMDLPARPAVS